MTYLWLFKDGSLATALVAAKIAEAEGMIAHTRTAEIRKREILDDDVMSSV
jgi:hypothetical protein